MWVATSESEDPCGSWFLYRLTFHGDVYPTGTMLDFPMLGQDTRFLQLRHDAGTPAGQLAFFVGILRALHERERQPLDAELKSKLEIASVFRGQC
jgi:hypothetical protein